MKVSRYRGIESIGTWVMTVSIEILEQRPLIENSYDVDNSATSTWKWSCIGEWSSLADSEYGDLRTTPMISDVSWRVNLYDLFDYVGEKGATSWRSEEPNITSSIQLQPEAGSRPSASSRKANTNQAPAKQSGKGKTAKSSSQTDTDDCGWGAIPALKKLHNIAVLLHTSVLLYQSWVPLV